MATDATTGYYADDCKIAYTVESGETTTAGHPFFKGQIFGIAETAGIEGDIVQIAREGVWHTSLKVTGVAWTVGMPIYWKSSTSKYTTVSTDGRLIGYAAQPATSGATAGYIMLAEASSARPERYTTATLASGTVTVTDAACTTASLIFCTWNTTTGTKTTPLLTTPGNGSYIISAIQVAGTTADTNCAGVVFVHIVY